MSYLQTPTVQEGGDPKTKVTDQRAHDLLESINDKMQKILILLQELVGEELEDE